MARGESPFQGRYNVPVHDYSPISEGGAAWGQAFQQVGQTIGAGIKKYKLDQEKRGVLASSLEGRLKAMGEHDPAALVELGYDEDFNVMDLGDMSLAKLEGVLGKVTMYSAEADKNMQRKLGEYQLLSAEHDASIRKTPAEVAAERKRATQLAQHSVDTLPTPAELAADKDYEKTIRAAAVAKIPTNEELKKQQALSTKFDNARLEEIELKNKKLNAELKVLGEPASFEFGKAKTRLDAIQNTKGKYFPGEKTMTFLDALALHEGDPTDYPLTKGTMFYNQYGANLEQQRKIQEGLGALDGLAIRLREGKPTSTAKSVEDLKREVGELFKDLAKTPTAQKEGPPMKDRVTHPLITGDIGAGQPSPTSSIMVGDKEVKVPLIDFDQQRVNLESDIMALEEIINNISNIDNKDIDILDIFEAPPKLFKAKEQLRRLYLEEEKSDKMLQGLANPRIP